MSNLLNKFKNVSSAFSGEVRRMGWALGILAGGTLFISRSGREILTQQSGVLAWKLVLLGTSVVVAHQIRQQLFPYLDLSAHLEEKTQAGATVFLGVAIIYAGVILALCAGL